MLKLRPYQEECLTAIEVAGKGRHLCQLATGLGKTVIFSRIKEQGKTLILAHREELVKQPLKYYTDVKVGVEMGKERAEKDCKVVSASVQSLARRLNCYSPDEFQTIIIDECHHATSSAYKKIINYFNFERLIGFTATPNRADGVGLEEVFDDIIFQKDLKYGIQQGYLSPIQCKRVFIEYDLSQVATRMGDYSPQDLARQLNVESCNLAIAQAIAEVAELPAIIFAVDVEHAKALEKLIPNSKAVSADSKDRAEVIEQYRQGKIKVLINCMLFTEGTDLPMTRTVLIARPTKSQSLYTQMVGRGTRLYDGKDHCLLIDCIGVSRLPICTAPTLLGLSSEDVPESKVLEIEGDLLNDIPAILEKETDNPQSWIRNIKNIKIWEKANSYNLHDVNYFRKPNGEMILEMPNKGGKIKVSAPDNLGNVVFTNRKGENFSMQAQTCYDYIFKNMRSNYDKERPLWNRKSAERWGREPAKPNQLIYMARLAKAKGYSLDGIGKLNRGECAQVITRLRNM